MINLYDSNITDILLEAFIEKPEVIALGYALNRAMQRWIGYCQNISVYAAIDTAPEQLLDLLAVELNTQYYDTAMDIEKKRSVVKNTLIWFMSTGTPAAVEETVAAVFGSGYVSEWFEYGGDPYNFKVYTSNMSLDDKALKELEEVITTTQNARSYLEEVIVEAARILPIRFSAALIVKDDITFTIKSEEIQVMIEDENGQQLVNEEGNELFFADYI